MLQYASSSRNLPVDDTRANTFPVGSILQQLHDDPRFFPDYFVHLLNSKFSYTAERITKRELSRQTPDSIGESFLITSTALRAYRNRHLGKLMRCWEAPKPFQDCVASFTRENLQARDLRSPPFGRKQKKHSSGMMQEWTTCLLQQETCANAQCCYRWRGPSIGKRRWIRKKT